MRTIRAAVGNNPRTLSVILLVLSLLPASGCNALNPLCGSTRPSPSLASLSATMITLAQVQAGYQLTVTGSHFVAASVVVINGTTLTTTILSSTQLQVMVTSTLITAPGTARVLVHTPSGNSSDLGCTSGGTSGALDLTIT